MKILKEDQCSAKTFYEVSKQSIIKDGIIFRKMGKSFEDRSLPWRFLQTLKCTSLVGLGVLCAFIPFCFKSYRKKIKILSKEIYQGKEKIIHLVRLGSEDKGCAKEIMTNMLSSNKDFLTSKVPCFKEAKLFVKLSMENDQGWQIFSIKNNNGALIDGNKINEEINNIKTHMNQRIDGMQPYAPHSIYCFTTFIDDKNELHGGFSYDYFSSAGGFLLKGDRVKETEKSLIEKHGFPANEAH